MTTPHQAVRTLASPGFVLALVVLVLNDHVLKAAYPGWFTGKLSPEQTGSLRGLGVLTMPGSRGSSSAQERPGCCCALPTGDWRLVTMSELQRLPEQ